MAVESLNRLDFRQRLHSFAANLDPTFEPLFRPGALSTTFQTLMLLCSLAVCLIMRLATLKFPAIDRTMWKEIDYVQISRNFWLHGFHFLQPEISWPAEPPRITAMEFPLAPFVAAWLYSHLGFSVVTVRLLPLIAYLVIAVFVFLFVRAKLGPIVALVASLAAALMPIHHQFGNILFSEPLSIAGCVATLFFFDRWAENRKLRDGVIACACFSLAIALKLEPLFLTPLLGWLWFSRHSLKQPRNYVQPFLFMVCALLLPLAWFGYAFYLSRTSIDVFGVVPFLKGHDKLQTLTMIQSPHFWIRLAHRLWSLNWALLGCLLSVAGLFLCLALKRARVVVVYFLVVLAYFAIVAEGQLDAPYRQLNAVPLFSIFMALGAVALCRSLALHFGRPLSNKVLTVAAALLVLAIAAPSFLESLSVDPQSPAHPSSWELAQDLRRLTKPTDRLIVLGEFTEHVGGNDVSPVLYYYTGLTGWTLQPPQYSLDAVNALIQKGATYLAVEPEFDSFNPANDKQAAAFLAKLTGAFQRVPNADGQIIFALTKSGNHKDKP